MDKQNKRAVAINVKETKSRGCCCKFLCCGSRTKKMEINRRKSIKIVLTEVDRRELKLLAIVRVIVQLDIKRLYHHCKAFVSILLDVAQQFVHIQKSCYVFRCKKIKQCLEDAWDIYEPLKLGERFRQEDEIAAIKKATKKAIKEGSDPKIKAKEAELDAKAKHLKISDDLLQTIEDDIIEKTEEEIDKELQHYKKELFTLQHFYDKYSKMCEELFMKFRQIEQSTFYYPERYAKYKTLIFDSAGDFDLEALPSDLVPATGVLDLGVAAIDDGSGDREALNENNNRDTVSPIRNLVQMAGDQDLSNANNNRGINNQSNSLTSLTVRQNTPESAENLNLSPVERDESNEGGKLFTWNYLTNSFRRMFSKRNELESTQTNSEDTEEHENEKQEEKCIVENVVGNDGYKSEDFHDKNATHNNANLSITSSSEDNQQSLVCSAVQPDELNTGDDVQSMKRGGIFSAFRRKPRRTLPHLGKDTSRDIFLSKQDASKSDTCSSYMDPTLKQSCPSSNPLPVVKCLDEPCSTGNATHKSDNEPTFDEPLQVKKMLESSLSGDNGYWNIIGQGDAGSWNLNDRISKQSNERIDSLGMMVDRTLEGQRSTTDPKARWHIRSRMAKIFKRRNKAHVKRRSLDAIHSTSNERMPVKAEETYGDVLQRLLWSSILTHSDIVHLNPLSKLFYPNSNSSIHSSISYKDSMDIPHPAQSYEHAESCPPEEANSNQRSNDEPLLPCVLERQFKDLKSWEALTLRHKKPSPYRDLTKFSSVAFEEPTPTLPEHEIFNKFLA